MSVCFLVESLGAGLCVTLNISCIVGLIYGVDNFIETC